MDIHLLERLKDIVRSAGTTVRSGAGCRHGHPQKNPRMSTSSRCMTPWCRNSCAAAWMALLPEAGFLGEEDATHDIAGRRQLFIVDPIDGTMNFIRGLHHSAISVALAGRRAS